MANPYQQQVLRRKLIYTGLIVALFTVSIFWRTQFVEGHADELAIREQSLGDVQLTNSIVRLSLTGSRGLVTCGLWVSAQDKYKKNQWDELQVVVNALTTMQPHFITPWLYHTWNFSYNVYAQLDRTLDKYYFLVQGAQMLARGERQNHDNPEMRYNVGLYVQHKICLSDETNVMRSLFQLSCIPPNERDPARFRATVDGQTVINWEEFEKFCLAHPQLVRRLRHALRKETTMEQRRQFTCENADAVIDFLADNARLPSLFEEAPLAKEGLWEPRQDKQIREPLDRFPVLPPPPNSPDRPIPFPQEAFKDYRNGEELTYETPKLGDEINAFDVARSWYGYAQEPLPPPGDMPGSSEDIRNRGVQATPRDLLHQKTPRMTTLIHRNYPARAQHYVATRLEEEGWFDDEGWPILDWFPNNRFTNGEEARVGQGGPKWGLIAWGDAYQMWVKHGQRNHLIFDRNTSPLEKSHDNEAYVRDLAEKFRTQPGFNLAPGTRIPELSTEKMSDEVREEYWAYRYIIEYDYYRNTTNYPHFLRTSKVEQDEITVTARKKLYQAEEQYLTASRRRALEAYQEPVVPQEKWKDLSPREEWKKLSSLGLWKKVLEDNEDYRNDSAVQENSAEIQLKYVQLINEEEGKKYRESLNGGMALVAVAGQIGQSGVRFVLGPAEWMPMTMSRASNQKWNVALIPGPFNVKDKKGKPLVDPGMIEEVMKRKGLFSKPSLQPMQAGGGPPTPAAVPAPP
jgi:hypothetical protein